MIHSYDSQTCPCPLCGEGQASLFYEDKRRPYLRCAHCALVFVPPDFYLSAQAEKAEYDLHDNQVDDSGYRRFLQRAWQPLQPLLDQGSQILDFGCGPGPALAAMMQEAGMQVSVYDHFYFPDSDVLKAGKYHAVTATEVIEHLHAPADVFSQWLNLLLPKGYLVVMTKLVKDAEAFAGWHYKNDPTHVCFFSEQTFAWLASQYGLKMTMCAADVVLFQRLDKLISLD